MWTNKLNQKKYIGRHAGSSNSSYKGSGKYFRRALKKFGEDNFEREILVECDSIEECIKWEQYYLDMHDAAANNDFYNISPSAHGGHHGADYNGKNNPMWGKKHPNHVPHFGKDNGMYGVRRVLSENPNSKKVKLVDPKNNIYYFDSLLEGCISIFGNDENYGKIKHMMYKTKENKELRKDATFFNWKGYYTK